MLTLCGFRLSVRVLVDCLQQLINCPAPLIIVISPLAFYQDIVQSLPTHAGYLAQSVDRQTHFIGVFFHRHAASPPSDLHFDMIL